EENYRQAMLNKMQNNEIILIATSWAYTGIDAPKCQGLIMGGAVAATSTTMQMIGRVLRKAPGKEFAVCVDFDSDQKQLHKQAVARQNAYRTE
ncbi:helicase-related protein, partial [Enterococcus faecium]|uniref:helicase-related protein n=1 Tax=Enterococcus faecium TaxID=1352 RepID=UPI0034E988DB